MQFLKIPKDQLFLITTLGCITGYFVWAEPMKKYMKEHVPTENTNTVSTYTQVMANAKRSLRVPALLCLNFGGLVVLGIAYRLYGQKFFKDRQYERAEAYANSLYEKLKEEKGDVGMES